MTTSFHNTTMELRDDVAEFEGLAKDQERKILQYLKRHPNESFTSETVAFLFPKVTPITSIRRAVCNLKKQGKIQIVDKTPGFYKRPIFVYQYVRRGERQALLPIDAEA